MVSLSLFTSQWWNSAPPKLDDPAAPPLRTLSAITAAAIFVQLILGAGFRHGAFQILPHIIGAFVVLFLSIWTSRTVRVRFGTVKQLRRWGIFLTSFIGTQFLLGIAAYWAVVQEIKSQQPTTTYVALTVAHVLVGALTLASSVVLALSAFRAINGNVTVSTATKVTGSRAEGSRA